MRELAGLLCCPSEEVEKSVINMSEKEIVNLANQLLTLAKVFKSAQAKALLLRKIANVDQRIETIERKYKLGDYAAGVKKSITGQDDEIKPQTWPSMEPLL